MKAGHFVNLHTHGLPCIDVLSGAEHQNMADCRVDGRKDWIPACAEYAPRLEEHLASWTKGCEGQKGSGENTPQNAPRMGIKCSGVLKRNTREIRPSD